MVKVQMVVGGRQALVDADMVTKMVRKAELVAAAMRLHGVMGADSQLQEISGKIIRLNRTIRKNAQFL